MIHEIEDRTALRVVRAISPRCSGSRCFWRVAEFLNACAQFGPGIVRVRALQQGQGLIRGHAGAEGVGLRQHGIGIGFEGLLVNGPRAHVRVVVE